MKEHIDFIRGFIKGPGKVGSITPSSPELALKMIEGVEADAENVALEIGCGTGAITRFLQKRIPDKKSFLGIEIERKFVDRLNREFPHLNIICGDACHTREIIEQEKMGKVSYIISGLPFVILPKEVSEGILGEVDKLMEKGCTFRTFQYAHGYNLPPARKFRERMDHRYGKGERSSIILRNVPPAYTLTWKTT